MGSSNWAESNRYIICISNTSHSFGYVTTPQKLQIMKSTHKVDPLIRYLVLLLHGTYLKVSGVISNDLVFIRNTAPGSALISDLTALRLIIVRP